MPYPMKRLLLLACFGILLFNGLNAQKLDFSIKSDSTIFNNSKLFSIIVEVTKGNGPYSFYLCDKEPWLGGEILEQYHNIFTPSYTFSNLQTIKNRMVLVKGLSNEEYYWKPIPTSNNK